MTRATEREAIPQLVPLWLAYAWAIAGTAVFVVSVPWIVPDEHPVLTICLVPIIVSAYVGGLGAGVVSTVVGVAGVGYLLSVGGWGAPRSAAEVEMRLASLGAVGFLVSALSEALHRSRGRAEESRRLQAVTVASIGDGVITTDAQGRVSFLNDEAARLTGWTNAGAQGQPFEAVVHLIDDTSGDLIENLAGAVLTSQAGVGRTTAGVLIGAHGSRTPIGTRSTPIRDVDGILEGVVAVLRDRSDEVRTEALLREQVALRERLARIAATAPGAICSYREWPDGTGTFMYVTPQIEDIFGMRAAEVIREASVVYRLVHPDDIARLRSYTAERLQTLAPWHAEFRVLHPTRGEIWVEGHGALKPQPDGGFVWHGFLVDITQRKHLEAALGRSEETLNRAQAVAHVGSWYVDLRSGDGWCSEETYRIFGVPPWLGFPGDRFVARVDPDDRSALALAWSDALIGAPFDIEARLLVDGSEKWVRVQADVKFDAELKALEAVGTVQDVTERKRAEAQVLRSQKLAALGTMAGGVAHDFNNILLAITGNAKLAGGDLPADDPAQGSIREIVKAGERATELVRRIMTFARGEEEQRDVIAVGPILQGAVQLIRRALPAMIDVRLAGSSDEVLIAGKPGQIEQVLVNLATNGAEAIGAHAGVVDFRLDVVDVPPELAEAVPGLREGRHARITVSDTGGGIERDVLGRIFDPFFTTKPRGKGTGLGLAVVHGIMASHGGAVTVESEARNGSTFRLYFPVVEGIAATTAAPAPAPANDASPGRGERILYVDDDDALVLLITRVLGRLGYVVIGCNDATRALQEFRAHPQDVDVIVTDLAMPGMSGFELSRRLREVRADVPIVMTSGYVRQEDEETGRALGLQGLILKPNTIEALGAELDRVLRQRRGRAQGS